MSYEAPIVPIEDVLPPAAFDGSAKPGSRASLKNSNAPLVELRRQSDKRSAEMSLERQAEVNGRAAARLGRTIVKTFTEPHTSGRRLLHERPVLLEAMRYVDESIAAGRPTGGFMVEAVHRIARRGSVAHALWEFAEERGLGIWMASYPSALTRAQYTVEASRGTENWQETMSTLHLGRRLGAQCGRVMGPVKWGFEARHDIRSEETGRVERGRWMIDEVVAVEVRLAFRLWADEDLSAEQVVAIMNRENFSRPRGCEKWTVPRLIGYPGENRFGIFGDPVYVGWVLYDVNPEETVALGDEMDRTPICTFVPELAVIRDAELWKTARDKVERVHEEILARRSARGRAGARSIPRSREPEQHAEILLKDRTFCAGCSEPLVVRATHPLPRADEDSDERPRRERWFGHAVERRGGCDGCRTLSVDAVDAAVLLISEQAMQGYGRAETFARALEAALERQVDKLDTEKRRLRRALEEKASIVKGAEIAVLKRVSSALSQGALRRYQALKDEIRTLERKLRDLDQIVLKVPPGRDDLNLVSRELRETRRSLPFEATTEARIVFRNSLFRLVEKVRVRRIEKRTFGVTLEGPILSLLCDDPDVEDPCATEWEFRIVNRRPGVDAADRVVHAF